MTWTFLRLPLVSLLVGVGVGDTTEGVGTVVGRATTTTGGAEGEAMRAEDAMVDRTVGVDQVGIIKGEAVGTTGEAAGAATTATGMQGGEI